MGLITDATDTELEQTRQAIVKEQERRRTLATAGQQAEKLNADYLAASGVEPGQEWRQPTSAVDAYPKDWEVTFEGKTFVSLTPANVWAPNVSGWREVVTDGEAPAEYVAPSGGHDAYQTGDTVTFEGAEYKSLIDGNVWSPADYPQAWEKVE